ncbi:transposase [Mucilaginibacter sp. BJC16-A38]|uniref:transposase n=1 Tax=Mucilaginibacter phenanthrenivorans TaxID=1234842 RepID=UPI0021572210|nr:transposase [Mucilaginibacter phenanthrenivorans]MCR8558474.1 transposase [Mucilaginibacter phenanthrenivorans]
MDDKFKSKYRIPSTRLTGWDYGSNALYYITICTKDKLHYFGEIDSSEDENLQDVAFLSPTIIGNVATENWISIPDHFPFVELDEFVIMPNHIHAIIFINKPDKPNWEPNKFGVQSQNLGSVIRGYKASVKTFSTINYIEFVWQPRYHDRVIRSDKEYMNVKNYIIDNPRQWLLNGDNEDYLFK